MTGAPITLSRIARRTPRATLRLAGFHATLLRHSRGRADRWFGSRLLLLAAPGARLRRSQGSIRDRPYNLMHSPAEGPSP
jgi:hypothetical protein